MSDILETHTVPPQDKPIRLSDYATGIFQAVTSKKGMKKAIERNRVYVNGILSPTSKYITGGEVIELKRDPNIQNLPVVKLKIPVLYEDDYLAIVNKPAGLIVSGNKKRTLENALPHNLKKSKQPDMLTRPQAIHRLDFPTSGVLIIGKTTNTVTKLNKLFEERKVAKTYHAITIGEMAETSGTIESVIKTKAAKTKYELLKSIDSEKFEKLNLLQLTPITGRRHQLRIHLSELGHPILGDAQYGKEGLILKGKGLYLHSAVIQLEHPITQEPIAVEARLPEKFNKIFGVSDEEE